MRGAFQKTLIRVGFSQPGKRIIASGIRRGLEMLLERDDCDGAHGRNRKRHNVPIPNHGAVRAAPSTAGCLHPHLCWAVVVPENTTGS